MISDLLKKIYTYTQTEDAIDLEDYVPHQGKILQTKWQIYPTPFLVIEDIFTKEYAEEVREGILKEIRVTGLSETTNNNGFSRVKDYDAYSHTPMPSLTGPFRVFYSREWYQLFKDLTQFPFDKNVITGLHHHKVGSKDGYIHTDFNFYGFRERPFQNGLNHWYRNSIYQEAGLGATLESVMNQENVILTRRAIALIYYVDTAPWKEGDGGETAFYTAKNAKEPVRKVPPKHNSLLVFQMTPTSFHGFIENKARERNTVIQWFHEPASTMDKRLGI